MSSRRSVLNALYRFAQQAAQGSASRGRFNVHIASEKTARSVAASEQWQRVPWHGFGLGILAAGLVTTVLEAPTAQCAPSAVLEAPPGRAAPKELAREKKTSKVIVFVLGGPGSGKGTQCAKLVEEFGLVHLSAGDLLRAHMKSGTPDGNMVAEMIKQGTIVPSHVTISLLEKAMQESGKRKFLIDGFPRNEENRASFESQTGEEPFFILFFDCPEEVMEKRLLSRGQGRTDDNIDTIRRRFKVFLESSMPVVDFYDRKGKVYKFDSNRAPEDIYSEVRQLFLDLEYVRVIGNQRPLLMETGKHACDEMLSSSLASALETASRDLLSRDHIEVFVKLDVPLQEASDIPSSAR